METNEEKNWNLTYGRVEKAKKMVSRALNLIQSASQEVKWACEMANWNDEVVIEMEEAAMKLGYSLATLTTWDDDSDD